MELSFSHDDGNSFRNTDALKNNQTVDQKRSENDLEANDFINKSP